MKLDNYLIYNRLTWGSRVQEEDRKFRCMNLEKDPNGIGVHGLKGSGVQGCIPAPGLHLGSVFTTKVSASSGLIQNLETNWQLFGKMSIFNEDFGSLMASLSLTLNVEL